MHEDLKYLMEDENIDDLQLNGLKLIQKKDGFKFVGSTICYAFMQAVGMVNDHVAACDFR